MFLYNLINSTAAICTQTYSRRTMIQRFKTSELKVAMLIIHSDSRKKQDSGIKRGTIQRTTHETVIQYFCRQDILVIPWIIGTNGFLQYVIVDHQQIRN